MEVLTSVLARHMYSIDLRHLPLDKLCEDRATRIRAPRVMNNRSGMSHLLNILTVTVTGVFVLPPLYWKTEDALQSQSKCGLK